MAIINTSRDSDIVSDRSAGDRKRHREKVREAIKENIGNIIGEEAIIGQSGDKKIKVPIKGIKEYRFVYGNNSPGAGVGTGNENAGDIIHGGNEKGPGAGPAGSDPGENIYETEITLDEITELLFEDLKLPDMEKKKLREIAQERLLKRKGYQHNGIRVRLSRKKTIERRLKRKQGIKRALKEIGEQQIQLPEREIITRANGSKEKRFPFHNDDIRYNKVTPNIKKQSNAVIFCLLDTSGSMDTTKKYLARSFYFLLYRFILTKYQNTEVVFIAHHTEAKEVTEDDFFHKAESGGTKISSGYKKTLEIIESRYHPALWNIYAFHCSDGDNFDEDNEQAIIYAKKLAEISNLFGYGEIKPQGSYNWSSMLERYKEISEENFITVKIHDKSDLWPAFKTFLSKDKIKD